MLNIISDFRKKVILMKIQLITMDYKNEKFVDSKIVISSFHDYKSLDDFDINIIDLNNKEIWKNNSNSNRFVNCLDDLKSLSLSMSLNHNNETIIIYPQNIVFDFKYDKNLKKYTNHEELKNIINVITTSIIAELNDNLSSINLIYENATTVIDGRKYKSAFVFENSISKRELKSTSGKTVVMKLFGTYLTTLEIIDVESLFILLKHLELLNKQEEKPQWIENILWFDDQQQIEIIDKNKKAIELSNSLIASAQEQLERNNYFKSILYTTGDELVKTVFDIINEMFGVDLSQFQDIKKEDFSFCVGEDYFVGEIKGVNSNVKSSNISQLDNHLQLYLEEHPEIDSNKVFALLVINHQRDIPPEQRNNVNNDQIRIARRNHSLIVESQALLKLFEQYKQHKITREECIEKFKGSGLLIV